MYLACRASLIAVGKESAYNAGDPGSIPGSGRSAGNGIGYPLQYSWASLVAQLVKNLPAMWETWVWSLGWEDPLEKGKAILPVSKGDPVLQMRKATTHLSLGRCGSKHQPFTTPLPGQSGEFNGHNGLCHLSQHKGRTTVINPFNSGRDKGFVCVIETRNSTLGFALPSKK